MRLLIVAQRVDMDDPILGFFHRWIEEFAKHCDSVVVIGQAVGSHQLPKNVKVLSLKKESGWPIPFQVLRFWWLVLRHSSHYDHVFVHMSPIWVVLGRPLFFLLRKPAHLWYEVRRGGSILKMAVASSRTVFSATALGVPFLSKKVHVMGHGIDTDFFAPNDEHRDSSLIVAVGRLTGSKRYPMILDCFSLLDVSYRLQIVGSVVTDLDQQVFQELQAKIAENKLEDRVSICSMPHHELPMVYRRAGILLHACIGGLDKAVLEAMACECPVVWNGPAAVSVLPTACQATDETYLYRAEELLAQPDKAREQLGKELRRTVIEQHSLQSLIPRLVEAMA